MRIRHIALTTAAVASTALVVVAAPSAMAAVTSVSITAPPATAGTNLTLTGTSTNSVFAKFSSGAVLSCPSDVVLTASSKAGSAQPPNGVAAINHSVWPSGCPAAGGNLTVTHGVLLGGATTRTNTTWPLTPTTATSGGVTQGVISGVGVTIKVSNTCTITATGSANGTYTNGNPSTIKLSSLNLTVGPLQLSGGATNCALGQFKQNDAVTLDSTKPVPSFNITGRITSSGAAANPVTVVAT